MFLRVFCKPFRLKEVPEKFQKELFYEEVIGLGYHPERLALHRKALLNELPRIAFELAVDDSDEIELLRQSLHSGEWGDGKIFVFPSQQEITF